MLAFLENIVRITALILFFWNVITAVVTAVWKPRTPEQYAAMAPRLAAVLKWMGATGHDTPNNLEAIHQFVKNAHDAASVYLAKRGVTVISNFPPPFVEPDELPPVTQSKEPK